MGLAVFDGMGACGTAANPGAQTRPKTPLDGTGQRVKGVSRGLRRPGVWLGAGACACRRLAGTWGPPQGVLLRRFRWDAH